MLGDLLKNLVNIVYPKACLICKAKPKTASSSDNFVCPECWAKAKRNMPPFCSSCGRHLQRPLQKICAPCIRRPLHFDRAFSPFVYEGVIKELIHQFKYKNKNYLGADLSRLMFEFIREYNLPLDYLDSVVPVPLHKTRLREREFNQAHVLSRHIAEKSHKPLLEDCLNRRRPGRTQTELEAQERFLNVRDAFAVAKNELVKGKNILLVDDVLTSGATCSEAAKTLKKAGANIVFVLTLAN